MSVYQRVYIIILTFLTLFICLATRPVQRAQRPDFGPDGQAAASLVVMICIFLGMKNYPITPLKTNMPMENPPFEEVSPIEHGGFPIQC